jgi:hypothetical protein
MVPELELVRLLAAVRLKSVPAEDGPETLTLPLSLILTSPAALALRLATAVVRAVSAEPMLPAVEFKFNVGVLTVPKLPSVPLVMFAFEVSDTEELPVTAPARVKEPPVAVSSAVAALIVPALELVRLLDAVRLKSVPAEEGPETLTLPLSLILTNPAALALRLATAVARAVSAEPMLPAVEFKFKVDVLTVPKLPLVPFVILALEVSDTEELPVTAPVRVKEPPVAVSSAVAALMVPSLELVRLLAAVRLKSVPAEEGPETLTLPLSLILTNPAALALRLATAVVRAVSAEPMLPPVEFKFKVEVVTVPKLPLVPFVISALEVSDTEELPVTAPARVKKPPVAVSSVV